MVFVLVVEIVSAVIALAVVVFMLYEYIQSKARKRSFANAHPARHHALAIVLLAAVAVHGISATIYASTSDVIVYLFGWLTLASLAASGLCMLPALRKRIAHATAWHNGLFVAAIVLIVAHVVSGRL